MLKLRHTERERAGPVKPTNCGTGTTTHPVRERERGRRGGSTTSTMMMEQNLIN